MARYTGPKLRLTRRLKFLPGLTSKKLGKSSKITKRPGQHGGFRKKSKPYSVRLEEKQKLRFNYGLSERQLINYIKKAKRIKGATGSILLQLIEMRLDNIVFRFGMASSIPTARQLIGHRHILLNSACISIPSYQCQFGDLLTVKDSSASQQWVRRNVICPSLLNCPPHLSFKTETLTGIVLGVVSREWIPLNLNELLIVEYYSRKI
jgi:small subunit ribosomal protein S4